MPSEQAGIAARSRQHLPSRAQPKPGGHTSGGGPQRTVPSCSSGEKQAAITRAEGEKQAAILQAEGQGQARLTAAAAEAESIRRIADGITGGNPAQYLIMMKYIESLREMSRSTNSKVIFMPVETSSVLSSIGAFKEVFGDQNQGEAIVPQRQPVVRG